MKMKTGSFNHYFAEPLLVAYRCGENWSNLSESTFSQCSNSIINSGKKIIS